jgi:hypothetical protein
MDDDAAEAAFAGWVEGFKASLAGGSLAFTFLSAEHLRQAFMAGRDAEASRPPEKTFRLPAL